MRKIVVFNLVSLDGFFAGPKGEIDWHNTDREFAKFAEEQTQEFKTLIFGHVTYTLMKSYWPTRQAIGDDPIVAKVINTAPKIVFSKKLTKAQETSVWKNVTLYKEINSKEIKKLKAQPGGDMTILGSGTIVEQFTNLGLVDEYRLFLNPVVLGKGKPMFKHPLKLKLLKTRIFQSGNVLLYYQPAVKLKSGA